MKRQTKHGLNLSIYLDQKNKKIAERLMKYHDHKMEIRALTPDAVVQAYHDAGKIEGYLDALLDAGTINEKEHSALYIQYTHRHL